MSERISEFDPEQRARQLRRRAIVFAKLQGGHYADHFVPARAFLLVKDDQGEAIRDEAEAVEILEHLVELQLLEEWKPMGLSGKTQGFAQRRFKITDRGYALWALELDPIPSIADERLGD
jgi:hypothetical protein